MRTILFLLTITPFLAASQVNRSAAELARETTKEYVEKKLFVGQPYTPISYGDIKSYKDKKDMEVEWMIEHKFEISRPPGTFDKTRDMIRQPYKFIFFLDHQMKVRRAESYYTSAPSS